MEIRSCLVNRQNSEILGQQSIRTPKYGSGIHGADCFDIRNLGMSVNTRIRPSGPGHGHLVVEQLLKCLLQLALDRSKLRLDLPSVEICTVISKCQLEVPHSNRL